MEQLADQLAGFHAFTDAIEKETNVHSLWIDFADILIVKDFLSRKLGKQMGKKIEATVKFAKKFLKKYQSRFEERHKNGFYH
jgi:aminoglycoside phosphotransferase family enzyme